MRTLATIWKKTVYGSFRTHMDFALPEHLPGLLAEMDAFIEVEIKPLEREHAVI